MHEPTDIELRIAHLRERLTYEARLADLRERLTHATSRIEIEIDQLVATSNEARAARRPSSLTLSTLAPNASRIRRDRWTLVAGALLRQTARPAEWVRKPIYDALRAGSALRTSLMAIRAKAK